MSMLLFGFLFVFLSDPSFGSSVLRPFIILPPLIDYTIENISMLYWINPMTRDIDQFKRVFDKNLNRFLKSKLAHSQRVLDNPFLFNLVSQGAKIALSGGKRIRPYVCYLMYRTAGGKQMDTIMPLLLGLELVHAFVLIHDDIIDGAGSRHGVTTVHEQAKKLLKVQMRIGDINHLAQSQALLVGDLIASWSAELFMKVPNAGEQFGLLMDELIAGEMLDVDLATRLNVTVKQIEKSITLKTSRYTFVHPMLFGRRATAKNIQLDKFSEQFGLALGVAFQIQDDLLDLVGQSKKLHKPVLGDLRERRPTIFTQYILDNGTAAQRRELLSMFGKSLTQLDQARVVALFQSSGSLQYGKELITKKFAQAEKLLSEVAMSKSSKLQWEQLLKLLSNRGT